MRKILWEKIFKKTFFPFNFEKKAGKIFPNKSQRLDKTMSAFDCPFPMIKVIF